MNLRHTQKNTGFTLIELLVVVSIILLLTGASIAGFIGFNDRQIIQTTAKEIQTLMRSGQVKARSGEGASECNALVSSAPPVRLKGYQVTASADAVILSRVCRDLDGVETLTERSRVSLEDTVSVNIQHEITFLALKGGVQLGAVNSEPPLTTITITGDFTGSVFEFEVHEGGEITNGSFN